MKPFENDLKIGDEGVLVEDLQQRLIDLGYNKCILTDESIGLLEEPTGVFGEVTQGCLESFQAKVLDELASDKLKDIFNKINNTNIFNLKDVADGIMDYQTWFVLNEYENYKNLFNIEISPDEIEIPKEEPKEELSLQQKLINEVVRLARAEVGVTEKGKNNYGKRVQEYQTVGSNGAMNGGAAWCQYFQNYLFVTACKNLKLKFKGNYSGYTPSIVNWGTSKGITKKHPKIGDIQVGDWGFVYSASRDNARHVFLIVGKKKNSVITIEGNTNPGGGSDGFGVFIRERSLGNQCFAVVKWYKLYE